MGLSYRLEVSYDAPDPFKTSGIVPNNILRSSDNYQWIIVDLERGIIELLH